MSARLIDVDPLSHTATYHDYDHSTGKTQIIEVQDIEPYLERNKALANDPEYKRKGIKDCWYHFASIPNSVLMEIMQKHHIDWRNSDDLPKLEKILSTAEYKYLRTVNRI